MISSVTLALLLLAITRSAARVGEPAASGEGLESALAFEITPRSPPALLDDLKRAFDEHGLAVVKTDVARRDEMVAEAAAQAARGARILERIAGRDVCYDNPNRLPTTTFSQTWQVTDFANRGYKRFDVRLDADAVVRSFPENEGVATVARTLLGTDDVRVLDVGLVVACPGAGMQHWHQDDASSQNNAVGIFYPLVPVPDARFGTAEFHAGSHVYGDHNPAPRYAKHDTVNFPLLDGEFLVYDYLSEHRGTPNGHPTEARPLLYAVFGDATYTADEQNWAPKGCEIDTECGRQEGMFQWRIRQEKQPRFLEDWFAYQFDTEEEDWKGLKNYTEKQFMKYYTPEGSMKYQEGFNELGEDEVEL